MSRRAKASKKASQAKPFAPFDSTRERPLRIAAWLALALGCLWLAYGAFKPSPGAGPVLIVAPVTDLAGVIGPGEERVITRAIRAHREATGVQIAVLTVVTTDGVPIEDFSFEVAERWGGGQAGRDDGVLFTLAVADRRMRVEVGRGLEEQITDGEAAGVLGELRGLLIQQAYGAAAARVVDRVIAETGGAGTIETALPIGEPAGLPGGSVTGALARGFGTGASAGRIFLVLGLLLAIGMLVTRLAQPRGLQAAAKRARFFENNAAGIVIAALLVALAPLIAGLVQWLAHDARGAVVSVPITVGVLGLVLGLPIVVWARKASLRHWRTQPRGCAHQDGMMRQVDPEGPDGGLSAGQRCEVVILSRVYDVWLCPNGHRALEGFQGSNPADECPSCHFATLRKEHWRTVRAATYSSSGTEERTVYCKHCDHRGTETRVIPQKQRSSTVVVGGSSGGGGGGGWSGGGGSFGGGGASGSW